MMVPPGGEGVIEAARALRIASRTAQGLPPTVDDPDALRRVAVLVMDARREARRASQSRLVGERSREVHHQQAA